MSGDREAVSCTPSCVTRCDDCWATADAGGADAEAVEGLADATFDALDRQHDKARHVHASECCWPFAGVSAALREGVSSARASTAQDEGAGEVERLRAAVEALADEWDAEAKAASAAIEDDGSPFEIWTAQERAKTLRQVRTRLRAVVDRAKGGA